MKITVQNYAPYGKDISIRTSGRVDLCILTREKIQGGKDNKIYYSLHRGYLRNSKLKVIGIDIIDGIE